MRKKTTDEFISEAKKVHGDKYDYSKVNYVNDRTKVTIICPKDGEFEQTPNNHLRGRGCPYCANKKKKKSVDEFISDARKVHGDKYDYSKVNYVNSFTKVTIICPKDGEFEQTPNDHLRGKGCPKCSDNRKTTDEFISDARKVHGDKYDYSKVNYVNNYTKVTIICPKDGEFEQTPSNHLSGKGGCPYCNESKLENQIKSTLDQYNIKYICQYRPDFLKTKDGYQLSLDFYLPDKNIAIECQGLQHYISIDYFGGKIRLDKQRKNDSLKKELCKGKEVKLICFTLEEYKKYDKDAITDIEQLMQIILQNN